MPDTIQQLTFEKNRKLEWREVPRPQLERDTSALVRPIAAARCDADCLFLHHNKHNELELGIKLGLLDPELRKFGTPPFAGPFAYGHECVAEIVKLGSAVNTLRIGQRVVVPFTQSCGKCALCLRGLTAQCNASRSCPAYYGFTGIRGGVGGALSDLLHIPFADAMLVPVPDNVSSESVASAGDNITDGYRSVSALVDEFRNAPVLIVGGAASSVGLYAAGIAVALGASRVDYVDRVRERLSIAESLGANAIALSKRSESDFNRLSLPDDYLITVDASGAQSGLEFALRRLAPGGVCSPIAFYLRRRTGIPLWHLYVKGAQIRIGVCNARAHLPAVLDLVASGRFDPSKVTTTRASWSDAPQALLTRHSTKVIVSRPGLAV